MWVRGCVQDYYFMWFKCKKNKERVHSMHIIAFDGFLSARFNEILSAKKGEYVCELEVVCKIIILCGLSVKIK